MNFARKTTVQRLTDGMRRNWVEKGYIHLKGALTRDQVVGYLAATDEVIAKYCESHPEARKQDAFNIIQTVERSPDFDSLIDHPGTFGVIVDLMGPYLQIMGTVIYVRYPSADMPFDWHTDGGASLREFRVEQDSRPLNFKIQYFLTDIPEENRGNFCLVPGSHRWDFPEEGFAKGKWPEGGVQLVAEAGDAVIFTYNLWHAVAPNEGKDVRRSVTFRYGQLWSRPWDYEKAPPEVLTRMTPRQRRLMGEIGSSSGPGAYYAPEDQLDIILDGIQEQSTTHR
ncbi:phytanoyl-CoA dioxygenase family protein [Chloroflexi bacterium TSY]|nr:phytanoyl-CoA dioxygenase family protein [Chloroflexi bacterium TSY]